MSLLNHTLTDRAQKSVRLSEQLALEYSQTTFSPEHLMYSLCDQDIGLVKVFEDINVNPNDLKKIALFAIEKLAKESKYVSIPKANERSRKVLEEAQKLCIRYGQDEVTPLDLLEAVITPGVAFGDKAIRRMPLALYEIVEWREGKSFVSNRTNDSHAKNSSNANSSSSAQEILSKYCENLNEIAKDGKIDPVIGREREMKQLIEILGKRISPNVLVIGEPGVGKTSVVGGLVLEILKEAVPEKLKHSTIYSLDVSGQLVAGAFKGEVEERMKSIIQAIKSYEGKAILFIDEIHILLDEKGPVGSGVVNLLKPELSRGELTLIGATTQNEFQKFIEKDSAFNRRFSKLVINEPDEITAVQMLEGLVHKFEEFHGLQVEQLALTSSVGLAKKYIKDKLLPASAIELLDFTMACANQMNATSKDVIQLIEKEIEGEEMPDLGQYQSKLRSKLSELLIGRLEEEDSEPEKIFDTIEKLKSWTEKKKEKINEIDVESITAYKSGIPMGRLRSKEQEKMQNVEEILKKRVVGQDHIIHQVGRGLKAFRANLKEPKDPGAIFFFTGSTGTGKTELAKAIAELLFDDEDAMIRFDMSEFQESHSVASLLGAPPGYVGFDAGGILVNNVRKKPYSVVLFDEIEKAHPDIFGIFLQMLTDGRLTDKKGKVADFSNVIVIFTSNAGAHEIVAKFENGEHPTPEELKGILRETKHFKDEFLGRVDSQILPFKPITEDVARLILDIHYGKFVKMLKKQHKISLSVDQKVKDHLIEIGFSPIYGARPLKNAVKTFLTPAMADKIIMGEVNRGDRVHLTIDDRKELDWTINKTKKEEVLA